MVPWTAQEPRFKDFSLELRRPNFTALSYSKAFPGLLGRAIVLRRLLSNRFLNDFIASPFLLFTTSPFGSFPPSHTLWKQLRAG